MLRPTRSSAATRHLRALIFIAALGATALPTSAQAQQPPGGEKAEAYYNKGVDAFFNKEYSQAITYFQRAHTLDPNPVVLYNISLAHAKLGNVPEALGAALEAQKMGGLPEDTTLKNQARIRAFQRALTAEKLSKTLASRAAVATAEPPTAPPAQPAERDGMGVLGWTGIGIAGAGVATLAGVGVLNFMLADDVDAYDKARAAGDFDTANTLYDDINDRQSIGQIMLYSGIGLVAVGGALWAVDYFGVMESTPRDESRARTALFGTVAPGHASVQAQWQF